MSTPAFDIVAALADTRFLASHDPATGLHAVRASLAEHAASEGRTRTTAVCWTATTRPTGAASPFNRADAPPWITICPACAWTVAIETGPAAIAAELDRLTPTGDDLAALERLSGDALLMRRTCEAILAAGPPDGDEADPGVVDLLVHAVAHAPVLLSTVHCPTDCDHPDDRHTTAAACPACSLTYGGWAGESEGHYRPECTVAFPCQVLAGVARSFGAEGAR